MIHFQSITAQQFLTEYWQKKPLVIRQALPNFINPLSPDELAGLALEEDMESRIVLHTPQQKPYWQLKRGPFNEADFTKLPQDNWTLLVQGVDRVVEEVYDLLHHFDFIPQWRFDDVMISFASLHGSVGPHYDHYDVFLYQGLGRRNWSLSTKNCTPENYLSDLELRIMDQFECEEEFVLEEGDMLYLPPHVAHYGISLSEECMTYSFGYRSYQAQELWDSLGEYAAEHQPFNALYQDPNWSSLSNSSELTPEGYQHAKQLLAQCLNDDGLMTNWFGCFATRLDTEAERQLPMPLEDDELMPLSEFIEELNNGIHLKRDACCRFAYQTVNEHLQLYINGCEWDSNASSELMALVANSRLLTAEALRPFLSHTPNQLFLYDLWKLQWLYFSEEN